MRVDIWSDVVCPWCYVGQARFEKALDAHPRRNEVEVVYRAFELDPGYPAGQRGETNLQMLGRKYGLSPDQAREADGKVGALARAEGLGWESERPIGNTCDLHRVIRLGLAQGVQHEVVGALNEAYFARGRQVFDPAVLTEVTASGGLDPAAVTEVLEGEGYTAEVQEDELRARALGISGVPYFVFDMRLGVSGAQSAEMFTRALDQALEGDS
jgi:predicted DsbA family dithiol-disulfide isomerase